MASEFRYSTIIIDPRGYSLNFELPAVIINKKKKGILSSRSIYNNPIIRAGAKINLIT